LGTLGPRGLGMGAWLNAKTRYFLTCATMPNSVILDQTVQALFWTGDLPEN